VTKAISQLVTRSSRHTVMLSLGQLVTGQLVTCVFFSHGQVVTWSSRHKLELYKAMGRVAKFSGHADIKGHYHW